MKNIRTLFKKIFKPLVALLILAILILIFASRKEDKGIGDFKLIPEENDSTTDEKSTLIVTGISPEDSDVETWSDDVSFTVSFSEPVKEENIKIRMEPYTELRIIGFDEPSDFIYVVIPKGWYEGIEYKLIIEGATSEYGSSLSAPYEKKFLIKKVTIPGVL